MRAKTYIIPLFVALTFTIVTVWHLSTSTLTQEADISKKPTEVESSSKEPAEAIQSSGPATLYVSEKFGIAFNYATKSYDATIEPPYEDGARIYLDGPDGQWVEVIEKYPAISLADAITQKFLAGVDPKECFVTTVPNIEGLGTYDVSSATPVSTEDDNILYAVITFPVNTDPDGPWWSEECGPYATTNGLSYFYYNTNFPDRYYYFSIGQYTIFSGIRDEALPFNPDSTPEYGWHETFTILK